MACKSNRRNISKMYKEINFLLVNYISEYLTSNANLLLKINDLSTDINGKKEEIIALIDEYIADRTECCAAICKKLGDIIILIKNLPCVLEVEIVDPVSTTTTTILVNTTTTTVNTNTTTLDPTVCNSPTIIHRKEVSYPLSITKFLGTETGWVTLTFNAYDIPDRFEVWFDNNGDGIQEKVIDTGYIGEPIFQAYLNQAIISFGGTPSVISNNPSGSFAFYKASTVQYATVLVYAPLGNTAFEFTLSCPVAGTTTSTTTTTVMPVTTTTTTTGPTTTTTTGPVTTTTTTCAIFYPCGIHSVMNNTAEYRLFQYRDCGESVWFGGVSLGPGIEWNSEGCKEILADCLLDVVSEECVTTTTTTCGAIEDMPLFYKITIDGVDTIFTASLNLAKWAWCEMFSIGGGNKSMTAEGFYSQASLVSEGLMVYRTDCSLCDDGYYIPLFETDKIIHIESGEITEIFTADCPFIT